MNSDPARPHADWLRLTPWLIVVTGLLSYLNTFGNPFLFDDANVVVLTSDRLRFALNWLNPRALVNLTFIANSSIDARNPAGYHAVNVAIHILAALLLAGIVRRTLRRLSWPGWTPAMAAGVGTAVGMIWVAHPLQTESVTYICQRYESLMGLLFLSTLYAFVRSLDSRRPAVWLGVSVAACWLGMETKEVMVLAPVLVAMYDGVFGPDGWGGVRRRWRYYLPLAMSLAFAALIRDWAVRESVAGGYAMTYPAIPWPVYLMTQPGVILHYLRLSILPMGQCLDYAWPPVESLRAAVLPVGILAGVIGLTAWGVWRRRAVAYLGAWFFLILAPSSSVIPLYDMAFEHRMYLPLAAVVVLIVVGGANWLFRIRPATENRRAVLFGGGGLVILLTVVLALTTVQRNRAYASAETMWRDVLEKAPHNERQRLALIASLNTQERYEEAGEVAAPMVARLQKARQRSAELRYRIPATDPDLLYPMAVEEFGTTLLFLGQVTDALTCFREVAPLRPSRRLHHNMALALLVEGDTQAALREIETATALDRRNASSWAFRGEILDIVGRSREAMESYERAIQCDGSLALARIELAWLLATCPEDGLRDGKRAVELAESALALSVGRSVRGLDVLAAAYAETGQFKKAVGLVGKALNLLNEPHVGTGSPKARDRISREKLAMELRARQVTYEGNKAFRETTRALTEQGAPK